MDNTSETTHRPVRPRRVIPCSLYETAVCQCRRRCGIDGLPPIPDAPAESPPEPEPQLGHGFTGVMETIINLPEPADLQTDD